MLGFWKARHPLSNSEIFSGKKILLVDDEDALRAAVAKILASFGATVVEAVDGKMAQNMITIEEVDLVLSDIRMPGCTGIELLHFVKRAKPNLPVILTTGFGELKETKEAYELGAKGFIAKPFTREDLKNVIVGVIGVTEAPKAPDETDHDYCKLNIDDFITGKQIKFDIFIKLSKDKYVKIAHEGDDIPVDRIRLYKSKNITHLYMKQKDFAGYIGFNLEIANKLPEAKHISNEKKMNFLKHTGEIILEHCFLNELTEGVFESAQNATETTVSVLFDMPDMAALLESLNHHSDHLYAHCVGVSFYSSMIAKAMDWENPRTLYKISTAGLLHDIGKKEFDKSLLQKNRSSMTSEEFKIYQTHPSRGAKILSEIRSVPGDILQIVQQHHENCLGTGWPAGLKKNYIHPMARVVTVADELCHMLLKSPWSEPLPVQEALEKLYISRNQEFDHAVLDALIKLFNADVIKSINDANAKKTGSVSR